MRVGQSKGGGLSRLCSLSGYSRQAYYKRLLIEESEPLKEDLIIQKVVGYRDIMPRIGGRKLFFLIGPFMKLHRLEMGRDAFFEMLGRYGLLVTRRRGKPRTTDSDHWMKKYPNLVDKLVPMRPDRVWVSDITYLDLYNGGAVYLSLVTDAYSRKIVGFHISESLTAEGCLQALEMALAGRTGHQDLIHHSDRGTQYCCNEYVKILQESKIDISMTQSGDPRDNAIAERVNGILKMELLQPMFTSLEDARNRVAKAVNIYNYLRPHSSISMLAPALVHAKTLPVRRRWKNYHKKRAGKEAMLAVELST